MAHVSSRKVYVLVFAALLVLTGATVWVAQWNLGPWSDVVALAIAVTKGTLVVLFFMHVKDSSRLTKLTVLSGFLWLGIMIAYILSDYLSRPAINAYRGVPPSRLVGQLGESQDQQPQSVPVEQRGPQSPGQATGQQGGPPPPR